MGTGITTLNLGSGKDWRKDCINADIQPEKKPDWVLDITNVPWGDTIVTRLGMFQVEKGMFSKIIANDVLEHIPNLVAAMTSCKDLLEKGGEMHIHVPYDLSLGAWQDPTHVRAFNENSFLYYTDWHWYLNWEDRFTCINIGFELSELGSEMAQQKISKETILRTPRAVDAMQVILKKE
jgi:SAM-dependent methyltransferase